MVAKNNLNQSYQGIFVVNYSGFANVVSYDDCS